MKAEYFNILRSRFPAQQYTLLQEVRDAAGFSANRSADAIAIGLWPSRGLDLHGIEVKSGRGDWLKELKNPVKQESIYKYCDRFWLLATNETVVLDETEIPTNWGYLLIKGKRLITKKEAPALKPEPLSRHFLAALMKRATEGMIHPASIEDKINVARERQKSESESHMNRLKNEHENLKAYIKEFEKKTGITFIERQWFEGEDAAKLGAAVKVVLAHENKIDWYVGQLHYMNEQLKKVSTDIEEILVTHPEIATVAQRSAEKRKREAVEKSSQFQPKKNKRA